MNVVFRYNEMCPFCGEEASGECNEELIGTCNHCGAKIAICSMCPGSCPERFIKAAETDDDADDICEYCDFYMIKCQDIDCSNCIAGRTKVTECGRIVV